MWFFWCILRLWATANYCRAGIKSLRGTRIIFLHIICLNSVFTKSFQQCFQGQDHPLPHHLPSTLSLPSASALLLKSGSPSSASSISILSLLSVSGFQQCFQGQNHPLPRHPSKPCLHQVLQRYFQGRNHPFHVNCLNTICNQVRQQCSQGQDRPLLCCKSQLSFTERLNYAFQVRINLFQVV